MNLFRIIAVIWVLFFVSEISSAQNTKVANIDSYNKLHQNILSISDADIKDGIVGGIVVLAGDSQNDIFLLERGFADNKRKYPIKADTIIDIASVTKVAATVTALLVCHTQGLIDFDAPFTKYLPQYKGNLKLVPTVRELANHTSGFQDPPVGKRLYFDESGAKMIDNILSVCQPQFPQKEPKYACWNYILLSLIIENVTNTPFDQFCRTQIFQPLLMDSTSLGMPVKKAAESRLAQTIGTAKAGEISDFVAYRIYRDGFRTGNAGMFTSARDMSKLLRCYLAKGKTPDNKEIFSEKSYAEIFPNTITTESNIIENSRNLGWVLWDNHFDKSKYGKIIFHSGWSGQTVCVDANLGVFEIVFTTRKGDYDRAKSNRFKIVNLLEDEFAITCNKL